MTALDAYQKLEALGLWRPSEDEQRREVVVALGDATLTVHSTNNQPLAHWSLAAIERKNPGERPAIFHPHGDEGETLELGEDAGEVIDALEKLRRVVARRRPRRGRLRLVLLVAMVLAVSAGIYAWLPGALQAHALNVVPAVKRAEIGEALVDRITRVSGPPCAAPDSLPALQALSRRVLGQSRGDRLTVLHAGIRRSAHLPGGRILLNKSLLEDTEDPNVPAGYVIAEAVRLTDHDPLDELLDHAGLFATIRLLTTGTLEQATLDAYAEHLVTADMPPLATERLLDGFRAAEISAAPYAYALDPSGETVLSLIEADPFQGRTPRTVLPDSAWLRLQAICEG
ncbi:hypothetical protein [Pseudaestuariivita atlantica]|uniref:Uncharacterized protein n=1 Tax=Pseudaestuariivita atlantica TaxID=1317121 RepID=A0A0L1JR25_9RHOB|nr:hypothetical protein [Pseudaestuariivita atlantica]KNG94167.1 hypothetical protein ATO11_08035 [Pseudaestuariivita atlantica]